VEREQKRLYLKQDSLHNPVAENSWVYYLLGGSKEQLAVYHGQEQLLTGCSGTYSVYLYPTEYLTYGNDGIVELTTKPDIANPNGIKERPPGLDTGAGGQRDAGDDLRLQSLGLAFKRHGPAQIVH
jgi:hypothetical protein